MIRDSARVYAQDKLMARVIDIYATETTELEIFTKMGLLGTTIRDTYRGLGADFVTYGLMAREGQFVDSGYRSRVGARAYREIIADGSSDVTRQRSRIFGRVEGHSRD